MAYTVFTRNINKKIKNQGKKMLALFTGESWHNVKTCRDLEFISLFTLDNAGLSKRAQHVNNAQQSLLPNIIVHSTHFFNTSEHLDVKRVPIVDSLFGRTCRYYGNYYTPQ